MTTTLHTAVRGLQVIDADDVAAILATGPVVWVHRSLTDRTYYYLRWPDGTAVEIRSDVGTLEDDQLMEEVRRGER